MNKAKRRITEFDFTQDSAHIALVDKAANEQEVLVMKSLHASDEEIEKAVKANLSIPLLEYLTRFLYMNIDDAETVAGMMGLSYEDLYEEDEMDDLFNIVQENLDKVTLSKSESTPTNKLAENLKLFKEKFIKQSQPTQEEPKMSNTENKDLQTELEKAQQQVADLEKAKADLEKAKEEKEALEKSFQEVNETVKVLKAAEEKRKEAEYLQKAKGHDQIVNDELPAEDLAKALRAVENMEGAEVISKALDAYKALVDNSDMFEEIGKSKTDDQPTGSRLDAAIEKAQTEHSVDYMKALEIVQKEKPELFSEEYDI